MVTFPPQVTGSFEKLVVFLGELGVDELHDPIKVLVGRIRDHMVVGAHDYQVLDDQLVLVDCEIQYLGKDLEVFPLPLEPLTLVVGPVVM